MSPGTFAIAFSPMLQERYFPVIFLPKEPEFAHDINAIVKIV